MINNIGIIGLGSIGIRHLRLARKLRPEIKIIAVRSGKGKKVQEEKIADEIIYNLEDAINIGIQAAIIATPATFHAEQALRLMNLGIHVLIEKPLSHTLENIDELLRAAGEFDVVGLVGYCFRYDPAALKFIEVLATKEIGQVLSVQVNCSSYLPEWRLNMDYRQSSSSKKELGGGVLLELSHELDYIRWFFGEMKSVYANIQNSGTLDIDVEDSADMIFESDKGYPVHVHLDFYSRNTRRECIARCSNGDLIWDAIANKVTWQTANGSEELATFKNDRDYIYLEQLKHFFDCIDNKKQPSVSLDDGFIVLNMIEAAKKSHKIGKKVTIT